MSGRYFVESPITSDREVLSGAERITCCTSCGPIRG